MSENRFNFIKRIIKQNKNLNTMIKNHRYTLDDANELVNKIDNKKIGKNNAIKVYNAIVDKAEKISSLRSTISR